jgi:hypothetical protein
MICLASDSTQFVLLSRAFSLWAQVKWRNSFAIFVFIHSDIGILAKMRAGSLMLAIPFLNIAKN